MTGLRTFVPVGLALFVAGCASSGDYPSLAQRPAERVEGAFAPAPAEAAPAPPPAPSADLLERLASLRRDAAARHAEFTAALPGAQRLAAAAGGTGTDSWASAQIALAELDSLRSRAAVALTDVDALWVDTIVESGPREAIAPVRDEVEALVRTEDQALARLRSRVGA